MAARPRKTKQPVASNAVDIAFEAVANDPSLDSPARKVLLEQVKLAQSQRRNEDLGSVLKVLTGLAGLAAAVGLGALVWDASQARGVVIEPFAVPPDLAAKGLTGEVVAAQVLDELQALIAASARGADRTIQTNGGQSLRLAIPATGVNLGDLQQALRRWLGNEIHVGGEVFRQGGGVTMRARTGDGGLVNVSGAEDDLRPLSFEAAKAVYRQTQPAGYASWLQTQTEDFAAAGQVLIDAAARESDTKAKADLLAAASYYFQFVDLDRAVALTREAQTVDSRSLNSLTMWANHERNRGHSEASQSLRERGWRDDRNGASPAGPLWNKSELSYQVRDLRSAITHSEAAGRDFRTVRQLGSQLDSQVIRALAGLHETTKAARQVNEPRYFQAIRGADDRRQLERSRFSVLYATENWHALAAEDPLMPKANLPTETQRRIASPAFLAIAQAKAMTGDLAGANQLIAQTALDCDRCVITRGLIAQAAGDVRTAEHWFAEAAKMMPTLPEAVAAWGQARVQRGDFRGALTPLREAQKRAPRWADPLRFEGDALVGLGEPKQALSKYEAAARLAPRWGGLHLAWGEALAKLGKTDEAKAKWKIAAGLDLTPSERARLSQLGAR